MSGTGAAGQGSYVTILLLQLVGGVCLIMLLSAIPLLVIIILYFLPAGQNYVEESYSAIKIEPYICIYFCSFKAKIIAFLLHNSALKGNLNCQITI